MKIEAYSHIIQKPFIRLMNRFLAGPIELKPGKRTGTHLKEATVNMIKALAADQTAKP